ncbi:MULTISPECIES: hypothetical protein [Rathayibacter]|uniref:DUF916 domain-containing protein n=1 Tax=Rathayibacter festucae DSM 15932 TaxID=1328866 RepID=A0A3Q9US08_9MICO|nr:MULTISPECIES: hypothetical protein [Rathayibacter]AZZ51894.1 hypothetical protein C1I64_07405 [Rathayibacter festucae DSM 15932]ROP50185.1 hypothetical protein EDF45_1594 [Rathayibacter sp. PhB186]ROS53143.1 hypothetical protein EDF44_1594 [Rathayibacter sp. PhB185]TCL83659.1 hypothetical protein EDF49_10388 [Rathayibacter sp. PhB192]TCM29252.1 hypothetical protein EDF43_10388 [Rathayibacter sp. PhB179]
MRRRILVAVLLAVVAVALIAVVLGRGEAVVPDVSDGAAPTGGGAGAISVSPVRSVVPAETPDVTLAYTIGNVGDAEKTYKASAAELDSSGRPISAATGDAGAWVSFDQQRVTVSAGASAPVAVRIEAPADRGAEERRVGVTFAEVVDSSEGSVGMATAITTSVYVQGTGTPSRSARVEGLTVPSFATGSFPVTATLINDGNVTVVPGATDGGVAGTISDGGQPFVIAGNPVRPASSGVLTGTVEAPPPLCWCQVRVSVADGNDGVSSVDARVLVTPAWLPGALTVLAALLVIAALLRARSKRRGTD